MMRRAAIALFLMLFVIALSGAINAAINVIQGLPVTLTIGGQS